MYEILYPTLWGVSISTGTQHMKKSRVWHLKMAANTKMGARKQCAQQCIQRTFLARVETQQHVPLYRTNKAVDDRATHPSYRSDSKSLETPANIRTTAAAQTLFKK